MLFVGGLHRSGTTLLASLLRSHPLISGFEGTGFPEDEGQHLQTVLPTDEHHGGPGRFAFTPDAHLTEDSSYATTSTSRAVFAQWSRYWDLSRPILLEKSPSNLLRFRLLQALFPGASFILMMRDPVPVTMSTRKWTPAASHRQLVQHWLRAHELAFADSEYLDHFTWVRYEDLVAAPDATMERLAAFLDLPARFDTGATSGSMSLGYQLQWASSVDFSEIGDLESSVNRYGYSLEVQHGERSGGSGDRGAG